jgi:antitoxin VapB
MTAKLFKHGGSQAVRLPKAFRFEGNEVSIEKKGDAVVLRPVKHKRMSLADVVRELRRKFPHAEDFPDRDQPKEQQKRDLEF